MKTYKLALIGKQISHSKSEVMYKGFLGEKLESYTLIDCDRDEDLPEVEDILEKFSGVSITSPFKTFYLNKVDVTDDVKSLGAVNCLRKRNSKLEATNTDYLALLKIIPEIIMKKSISRVILLGSGSMAKVTEKVFDKIDKIPLECISRSNTLTKMEKINFIEDRSVLIINSCSRNFEFKGEISSTTTFLDYNYEFEPHKRYLTKRCNYIDGTELLRLQARFALEFWGIPEYKAIE